MMSLPTILLVVFVISALTSMVVAERLTHVNVRGRHPERSRHWSASGIPRIGGIAVFAAAPIAIVLAVLTKAGASGAIRNLPELAGALVLSSAILFTVGLLDDLRGVKPYIKLAAQTLAAIIVYRAGFGIHSVSFLPGYTVHFGALALPITIVWLVGVSNAFNLVDGLDGLAGGVAIIGLIAVAVAGLILGNPSVPVYTVALVGSLLGFMKYNWPTARLFMGDSGSLVVGFLLAVLAVKGATDTHGVTLGLIPIFALAYPLLDTGLSILRRWLRGVPLSRADHRHVHHQFGLLGLGPIKTLVMIYTMSGFIAAVGLIIAFAPPAVTLVATMAGVGVLALVIAFGIYWLEYHEFVEAGASFASGMRKARFVIRDRINARDLATTLRGANSIEELQALLESSAETFRFAHMKLSDPLSRRRPPGRVTQELQALKLWKLEYPILQRASDDYDGLCLTIWSAIRHSQRAAGAERVARILAPAIAEWVGGRKRTEGEIAMKAKAANGAHISPSLARPQPINLSELRAAESGWKSDNETTLEA